MVTAVVKIHFCHLRFDQFHRKCYKIGPGILPTPCNRVRTGHGKPGKSWNFRISFSRPGKSCNLGVGHGKSWKMIIIKKCKINWVCLRRK